jgi:hypothetical protein
MTDSRFADKMIAAADKFAQDAMREEANLNNRLFRRDYRMENSRNNVTFSDAQVAAMTPR